MCWTPLYVNKNKSHGTQNVKTLNRTTQYVLDTSICKQKQITRNSERKDTIIGQHNMCWTPLYVNKNKSHGTQNVKTLNRTTQYVLDTSICKQKQITRNSERKDT